MFLSTITPTGKPPPLAVRLEQALPFRRCVRGEDVLWGSPASQTIQKPQAQYHGEARSSGVVPCRVPSLNEECALMHPLQGASFLSTPLQGGILKPPALRVVGDSGVKVLAALGLFLLPLGRPGRRFGLSGSLLHVAAHHLLDAQWKRAPGLDTHERQREEGQPGDGLAIQARKEPIQAMRARAGFGDDDVIARDEVDVIGTVQMVPEEDPK